MIHKYTHISHAKTWQNHKKLFTPKFPTQPIHTQSLPVSHDLEREKKWDFLENFTKPKFSTAEVIKRGTKKERKFSCMRKFFQTQLNICGSTVAGMFFNGENEEREYEIKRTRAVKKKKSECHITI
jgi:hypothetical protein